MRRLFNTLAACIVALTACQAAQIERKQLFDNDWLFALNDTASWRKVSLPHDWSIEASFDAQAPAGNDGGYLPTGRGFYRKTFSLGRDYAGRRLRLYFEGVYMNAEVYVNGQRAGGHPYGYSSFFVDLTPFYKIGTNTVDVRVDNSRQKNCRWYSGSGIYRHVWLLTTGQSYIDEWSVGVTSQVESQSATVQVSADVVFADGQRKPVSRTLHIDTPHLWSPDDPYLYHTTIEAEGDRLPVSFGLRTVSYSATEGLLLNGVPTVLNGACIHHDNGILGAAAYDDAERRKVRLLKEAGFNAVRTSHNPPSEAFLTACDELGLLVIDEAFDGWRESKNAHDYHELIDQWWRQDLSAMVLRDRLHPSIFCWSIGNEVIERKKIEVVRTAHQMATLCRELDPERRPVTSALAAWDADWEIYDPLAAEHDIVGYNYMIHKSTDDHQRVPSRVMMQTESYPRDAWQNYRKVADEPWVIGDFVWTGIDYLGESGIGRWYYEGDTPGEHYERPLFPWHAAYCGDIDLTGLRKPISHYREMLWHETLSSPSSLLLPPSSLLTVYMAVREPDGYESAVHPDSHHGPVRETLWGTWPTFESWNWPGWEGRPIDVEVYSKAPAVRLLLNDELIAEKQNSADNAYRLVFTLPYQPGTLRAEAVAATDLTTGPATTVLRTAASPAAIRLTADRQQLAANGQDLAFVTVELTDADGTLNPIADNLLTATLSGDADLLAFGNADIKDATPYTHPFCDSPDLNASRTKSQRLDHHAWKGRALIVVKARQKRSSVRLTVSSKGLKPATVTLHLN